MSPSWPTRLIPALLFVFVGPSSALTIRVPEDQPTIGAALSIAVRYDTVLVACGVYNESGLTLRAGVTFLGGAEEATCTQIRAVAAGSPILTIPNAPDQTETVVRGFTFLDGSATQGGAIQAFEAGLTIANCRFEGNHAAAWGGAIYAIRLSVTNCEFVDNQAGGYGGAIVEYTGPSAFQACTFLRNRSGLNGGAVFSRGRGTFDDCLFEANMAADMGGGLYVSGSDVNRCVFRADSSLSWGGGAAGGGQFFQCVFERNHAEVGGGGLEASFMEVDQCLFVENSAGNSGGGLAVRYRSAAPTVGACTFLGNRAPLGGGVAVHESGIVLETSVIHASAAGGAFWSPLSSVDLHLECCDFYGNIGGDWTGPIAGLLGSNGNFSADPLFCDLAAGIFTVSTASPLLPQNNECGAAIGSEGEGCESDGVVVSTFPPGLPLEIDGVWTVGPAVFNWGPGTPHTIGTHLSLTPLAGVQHEFSAWSDGGAVTHDVNAPPSPAAFVASFETRYLLTMQPDVGGSVTPGTGWVPARQTVVLTATPNKDYNFLDWVGTGANSYTGTLGSLPWVVKGPIIEWARFFYNGNYPLTMIAEGGGSVSPPSGDFHVGSTVTIQATQPPGFEFAGWIGDGPGSYTGPQAVRNIQIFGPIVQTARFRDVGFASLTMVSAGGGTVTPESGVYTVGSEVVVFATPDPGYTFHMWGGEGDGSYTGPGLGATVTMDTPVTQTAYFAEGGNFPLVMSSTGSGTIVPASGSRPAGTSVSIIAAPQSGFRFKEWQGTGFGSYSGPVPAVTITMNDAITQHAVFEEDGLHYGYEFSVSASDTDPWANAAMTTGTYRLLYLWLVCAEQGLSAFEGGVSSTLPVMGFSPASDIYNLGANGDLILAAGGCPGGANVPRVLGSWLVNDVGGELCLAPSQVGGALSVVDCGPQPAAWSDPVVHGFSSSAAAPCNLGTSGCDFEPVSVALSQLAAIVDARSVRVSWRTSEEVNHAGFHVYRSELGNNSDGRLTPELLVGENPYQYLDTAIEGDRVYFYKVGAVDRSGEEVLYGPVSVTTPPWQALSTAFRGVQPNPFRGSAQIRFALAAPGRARLTIYDVSGRLVRTVTDEEWPAGEHSVDWGGHSESGPLASGIYFVRFETSSHKQTERVVFLGGAR